MIWIQIPALKHTICIESLRITIYIVIDINNESVFSLTIHNLHKWMKNDTSYISLTNS